MALSDTLRFALLLLMTLAACALNVAPSPIQPAAPLPADPPVTLGTMQAECDAFLAALANFKNCEHLERDDLNDIDRWIETAARNLAAGTKAEPEPNAQKAIAGACHRAATSVRAANQRCLAGPHSKQPGI